MIFRKLTRYRDVGLLVLRVGLGISMAVHGWPKVMGGTESWVGLGETVGLPVPVVFGMLAALSEFIGGIALALGLYFRVACIMLAGTMVGALSYHLKAGDPFTKWSHAAELLVVFASLLLIGPGKYSVDKE